MDQDTSIKITIPNKRKRSNYQRKQNRKAAKKLKQAENKTETLILSPDNQLLITIKTDEISASGSKRAVKLQSTPEEADQDDIEMENDEIKSENGEKSYLIFKCLFCPEILNSLELREEHFSLHYPHKTEILCTICNKSVPSLKEHLELHKCKFCDITFLKTDDCRKHLQTHSYCFRCDEQFGSRNLLNDHWMEHHSKSFFSCKVCLVKFNRNRDLKIHTRLNHPEQEPIYPKDCFICNESFEEVGDYRKHVLVHMPYKCKSCPLKFEDDYKLIKHSLKIHPYECCGRKFQKKKVFDIHFTRHFKLKPYVCEICNAAYYRNLDLFRHKHCHKFKETRYKCESRLY